MMRWFRACVISLALVVVGASSVQAQVSAYWVSKSGSDSNPCTLSSTALTTTAKLTINAGLTCLSAGRTLYVRTGTYAELVNASNAANGSDFTTGAVSVSAYNGETVTVTPSSGVNAVIFPTGSVVRYQIWTGINIDCDNLNGAADACLYIGHDAHHIRWQQSDITHAYWSAVAAFQGPYIEILDNTIHDGGQVGGGGDASHGIYLSGFTGNTTGADQHITIRGNNIYNFTGLSNDSCIQLYTGATDTNSLGGTVIERNNLHACGVGTFLGEATTTPIVFKNNLVRSTTGSCVVLYSRIAGAKIYNNTIYGCGDFGVEVGPGGAATNILVKNNAIVSATGAPIKVQNDSGTSYTVAQFNDLNSNGNGNAVSDENSLSTFSSNITTAPGFTNGAGFDFTLTSGSANRDAGTTLADVTDDYAGTSRPQSTGYDIGAYEFFTGGGGGGGGGGGSSTAALHAPTGVSVPASCRVGDMYYQSGTIAGLYNCTASNTWGLVGNGGNNFFAVTGPTSSTKTFTFPNASATVLTTNAAVTGVQGGTGQSTYTKGDILASPGSNTLNKLGVGSDGQVLLADAASTNGMKWATVGGGGGAGVGDVTHTGTLTSGKVIIGNGTADITVASTTGLALLSSGALSAYAGSSCSAGSLVASVDASGVVTCQTNWTEVVALSDQDVASNTTPATDAELFFTMAAGGLYEFENLIAISSPAGGGTPDFKFNYNGPATLTGIYNPVLLTYAPSDTLNLTYGLSTLTTTNGAGTATTPRLVWTRGWAYSTGGGTGTSGFVLQWSQNTSGVNATRRLAGSVLRYRRIL